MNTVADIVASTHTCENLHKACSFNIALLRQALGFIPETTFHTESVFPKKSKIPLGPLLSITTVFEIACDQSAITTRTTRVNRNGRFGKIKNTAQFSIIICTDPGTTKLIRKHCATKSIKLQGNLFKIMTDYQWTTMNDVDVANLAADLLDHRQTVLTENDLIRHRLEQISRQGLAETRRLKALSLIRKTGLYDAIAC